MSFKDLLPLVRRMIPSLIAQDLVDVQPMSLPAGQVFAMRMNYGFSVVAIETAIVRLRTMGFDDQANATQECLTTYILIVEGKPISPIYPDLSDSTFDAPVRLRVAGFDDEAEAVDDLIRRRNREVMRLIGATTGSTGPE